jgi:uncharacterized membrane protein
VRRGFGVAGLIGLLLGAAIYFGAGSIAVRIPILIQSSVGAVIVFAILLLISLAEMPMMLYGLRQMARSQTTPRALVIGTFTVFVIFASVYASIFVVLTNEFAWGMVLAALCLARFAGGMLVK